MTPRFLVWATSWRAELFSIIETVKKQVSLGEQDKVCGGSCGQQPSGAHPVATPNCSSNHFPEPSSSWPFYPLAPDSEVSCLSLLRPMSLCLATSPCGLRLSLIVCFLPPSWPPIPLMAYWLCWYWCQVYLREQAFSPQEFTTPQWSPQPIFGLPLKGRGSYDP